MAALGRFALRRGAASAAASSAPGASTAPWPLGAFAAGAVAGGGAVGGACALLWPRPAEPVAAVPAARPGPHSYGRRLYVMRGPPGSGKSTLARETLKAHLAASGITGGVEGISPLARCFLLSTDDFFAEIDQETGKESYVFDFKKLGSNHQQNQLRCKLAMELGITPVIVDNTNASLWEMGPWHWHHWFPHMDVHAVMTWAGM